MSPTALALAAVALWSTLALLSVRLAGVPPLLLVGTALVIGGLCGAGRWREWRASPRLLALGVYGLFLYHLALFTALRLAPAVEANLINYLWPLLIVALAPLFKPGLRPNLRHGGGAALGFVGAGLLVTGGHLSAHGGHLLGYALAAAAALIWSTYSLATSRLGGVPTGLVGLFCLLSGALALACHFAWEPAYSWRSADLPWLLALGLGPMGLAFYAWDAAMKRGDPRSIGALSYLTPLASTLLLAAGTGRPLTAVTGTAMGLIVGGAALGGLA
ncbi:MAG: DMT family transporter [Elusimicrobia bacterium]|nr:DMT family transporter [Elusimicrobiota bacterium]